MIFIVLFHESLLPTGGRVSLYEVWVEWAATNGAVGVLCGVVSRVSRVLCRVPGVWGGRVIGGGWCVVIGWSGREGWRGGCRIRWHSCSWWSGHTWGGSIQVITGGLVVLYHTPNIRTLSSKLQVTRVSIRGLTLKSSSCRQDTPPWRSKCP